MILNRVREEHPTVPLNNDLLKGLFKLLIERKRPVNQQLLIQSFDQFHGMSSSIRLIL
jgi:hypothetical protein